MYRYTGTSHSRNSVNWLCLKDTYCTVFSVICTCASNVRFKKNGGALLSECVFPQSYTRFENKRWPEEGDVSQTGGARITESILYGNRSYAANALRYLHKTNAIVLTILSTIK